jgi:hypothetical protein
MSTEDYDKMSASEKKKEDWMNSKWRPMMGWTYMITCLFDFVVAPILWSILQSISHGQVQIQWQPLSLQGAGLFHVAMGAVLGIAAYGRTQEKLNGANNGGLNLSGNAGTTYVAPVATPVQPAPVVTPVATPAVSVTPAAVAETNPVIMGFGGKPAPIQPQDPIR